MPSALDPRVLHARSFVAGTYSEAEFSGTCYLPQLHTLDKTGFWRITSGRENIPSARPLELAAAIMECIHAGARIINLSLALATPSTRAEQVLEEALNQAVRHRVIIVAAAGNQGTVGSSAITRHPWVIPVVACDLSGRPMNESNLGSSIGRRGLSAPGDGITSLGSGGLWTRLQERVWRCLCDRHDCAAVVRFPTASATQIKLAVTQAATRRRASVAPPLDAGAAYQNLLKANGPRRLV